MTYVHRPKNRHVRPRKCLKCSAIILGEHRSYCSEECKQAIRATRPTGLGTIESHASLGSVDRFLNHSVDNESAILPWEKKK